ncbi:prolyl oligopeptidase family serine peptidase [Luteibacter anthropi]|uniref:S9 family peptidase n=1 Tax=Luteibacter anthropi TaxID=564369 RepID=UPI002032D63B|nr:prolyl oligopeptidase family serine peptidase [Luteibacter anthropi]URX61613.1 prolyl oligopeptidase family serine peptidase [Luteibacter anthropi]
MRSPALKRLSLACALSLSLPLVAQAGYDKPPEPLLSVMHAPLPAIPVLDPTRQRMLLVERAQYPSITRVAEPYVKLAGLRIEPANHSRHDASNGYGIRSCLKSFAIEDVTSHKQLPVTLPADACPGVPQWSPDGRRFVFTNTTRERTELWLGDALTGQVHRVEGASVNPVLEDDVQWLHDSDSLLVKLVPANLGAAPSSGVEAGPEIKESIGGKGESSTYEDRDTLSSPQDEALFDYYATSQLAVVDAASGKVRPVGKPAVYSFVSGAPDGVHVLVEALKKPYSYVTTYERFAHDVSVLDTGTGKYTAIASLPVADRVPVHGVPDGPRSFDWRATAPATLVWAEALDHGDWKVTVPQRDKVMMSSAPFTDKPKEIARTTQRFSGLRWLADGNEPFMYEFDANRHWIHVSRVDVGNPSKAARTVWDYSADEKYRDPGTLVMERLPNGSLVVRQDGDAAYLVGVGGSPAGDRPFLDRYSLSTGRTERLFRSDAAHYESPAAVLPGGQRFITAQQSPTEPPNLFLRTLGAADAGAKEGEAAFASTSEPITHIADPTPQVRGIGKRLVTYKRKDGVELSFTLYTPPGYKEGTRLPAVLYAYPLDYADPAQAGQVSGSQQRFDILRGYRLLLLSGYAIIDNASFPIVGDPRSAYDTYIDQLVMDAQAAVDKAVELGVVDRDRIGVTGHSHGALMTANLLAHTNLFKAGVATSGSYNKTLTPFGFQSERRSLWQAPKVYEDASAFFHADQIKTPLLLMHGMDDANPGTEPIQSPKLFQAIRGLGGTTRLVMLPHEPHWYSAMESNEQEVYEMLTWFDRYVKNAPKK